MQTIRWGVIGLGRFGAIHARVLASQPGVELAAICTRNAERLASTAAEFRVPKTYADYRDLLADDDVDAVSITTHWQEHYAIAVAALDSGKHLLLEKPMADTTEHCREILAAAARSDGCFMVGHVCRFDPRVSLAKAAIDGGRIGRIISMHARRNLPKAPGSLRLDKISPLMGDGVHDADMMMWFLDRAPSRVYAHNVRVDGFAYPDVGWAMLHFGDEAVGVVETNWRLPENTPTTIDAVMQVVGTEGQLTIDCAHTGLAILDKSGRRMIDTVYWPQQHGRPVGALVHEVAYFADCIREGRQPDVVTPKEAARAVAVMEAAEQSAAVGAPVEFHDDFA